MRNVLTETIVIDGDQITVSITRQEGDDQQISLTDTGFAWALRQAELSLRAQMAKPVGAKPITYEDFLARMGHSPDATADYRDLFNRLSTALVARMDVEDRIKHILVKLGCRTALDVYMQTANDFCTARGFAVTTFEILQRLFDNDFGLRPWGTGSDQFVEALRQRRRK